MDIVDKLDVFEAEVKSLLKHKMKKLKDKHGYVSTSMLTKKEKEQLKKNEGGFKKSQNPSKQKKRR